MNINIVTTYDISDCETCGSNFAEGGYIFLDDNPVYKFTPKATCTGGDHMSLEDLLCKTIEILGHKLEVK